MQEWACSEYVRLPVPRFRLPRISLSPAARQLGADWRRALLSGNREQVGRQLNDLLSDVKSLPWYTQLAVKKAANQFVRTHRPLPTEIASLAPFQMSESPLLWSQLQPGDVLFVRPNPAVFPGFLWAMHYSHCGIYVRPGVIMEASVDKGVRLSPVRNWMKSHAHMGFARVKLDAVETMPDLARAMDQAVKDWTDRGVKYNLAMWNEAGSVNGKSYCSELIWMIYEGIGIDLRDEPRSEIYVEWVRQTFGDWAAETIAIPAIAPDELALSSKLEFYSVGKSR